MDAAGLKPPFNTPGHVASVSGCCALCASPDNVKKGCRYWTFNVASGMCYLKAVVTFDGGHPEQGWMAGGIYPKQ